MTAADRPPPRPAGYPKGAWLIIAVETCERFSFYGMLAILVLFLTADQSRGGFRWPDADALGLLGIYSGLMYALPALGGWLADHVWGNRRAVTLGASLMVGGHFMMAVPAAVPLLVERGTGHPVGEILRGLDLPLGRLASPPGLEAALQPLAGAGDRAEAALLAYRLVAATFFLALALLVIGNALMKSTLVVLVGDLFPEGDPRRDGAYAYYYLGISLGAFASGIVIGYVAQRFGWHYGFTVAGVFMTVALALYLGLGRKLLGEVGRIPKARHGPGLEPAPSSAQPARGRSGIGLRLGLLFVLALILLTFEIGWYQLYGTWTLFLERSVDRTIAGFTVPVPWFAAFNALVVIVVTPAIARLLVRMESGGRRLDIVHKYGMALVIAAAAQLVLALAGRNEPAWWGLPLLAVGMLSLGELVAWPSTYGIVYRLAPAGLVAAAMGAWYLLTLGSGGYLGGVVGQLTDGLTPTARFAAIGALMATGATITLGIGPALRRLAARVGARL